jgi:hypothetical protein
MEQRNKIGSNGLPIDYMILKIILEIILKYIFKTQCYGNIYIYIYIYVGSLIKKKKKIKNGELTLFPT